MIPFGSLSFEKWTTNRCDSLKSLWMLIPTLSLIVFTSAVDGISLSLKLSDVSKNEKVCLTPGCVMAASDVLKMMDKNVMPCDDFYKFACGQFVDNTIIPDDKSSVTTFGAIDDKLQSQLRLIISTAVDKKDIEPFKMVKKAYSSCMNEKLINERGSKPFNDILDSMGGFPVVKADKWDEKSWTWQKLIARARKHGFSTDFLLNVFVDVDLKKSTKRILNIDQPSLPISREVLIKGFEDKIVQAYYKYQIELAVLLGADKKRAEKEMKDVVNFEIALAKISIGDDKRRDSTVLHNPMTIKVLQQKYPYNYWLAYINSILSNVVQVKDDEIINVSVLSFMDKLGPLLKQTSNRTIGNYITSRIATTSSLLLSAPFQKIRFELTKVVTGSQQEHPRWNYCIDYVTKYYQIAVSTLYVRKYFKQNAKTAATEMVNLIRAEFESLLKSVTWMDSKTKAEAVRKLKAMVQIIGYPNELLDDQKLIEFYGKVLVDDLKFFESTLTLQVSDFDRKIRGLRKPVNKTDWTTHSKTAIVNAWYEPNENSIQFPAGILQGHFFSADRPRYMNFGAIGLVIGHEITHGFDDEGRRFDLNGNLLNWWAKTTEKAFLGKAQCIIDQYGNFTEPLTGLKLNGVTTQGENIADNGGIKEAYFAYKNYVKQKGVEQTLPGLNYTPNQLFWISAAQTWCSVFRKEKMRMQVLTNEHSPPMFRVLGPMGNMKEFSDDFHCAKGTKMNPVKKCTIW